MKKILIVDDEKKLRDELNIFLSNNDFDVLFNREERVCRELLAYNRLNRLKPVVTVEYQREAYVAETGNVRITFDKDISVATGTKNMFERTYSTSKILDDGIMVLEVKYDDYLPSHIRALLRTAMTERCAISKYVMSIEKRRSINYR